MARLETRRSKRGARLAFMWLCVDGVDGVRPVVVFPPAYEPLAGKIGIGSRVRVEGTHGAGEYPEAIYADHISLAK
ncbi:MAG: OB-fold nucleic acid binding domain-containing protein [Desulfarculaceae bacterium]|nr:OB-fold nucleic acid binding domain-containing protein [Desulfarculaceae bacterium]MCF8102132.1 OB-fold nucleic acid binding domain-containing protein [Desulfarculaceae bacterium]MCF8118323.1 OB-fold nucleic acid binding domain-containing protein [Desulfarculaceae bacterium]